MIGFYVADALAKNGLWDNSPFLSLLIVLVVSMATCTFLAVLLERVAYRPLRGAPRLIPLITAIGASFFLEYAFRGLFGAGVKSYPAMGILSGHISILGIRVLRTQLLVIVSALLMMAFLYWFVEKTKTGRAMRAVAEDKEIAALDGG